jgi:hypothetical protein
MATRKRTRLPDNPDIQSQVIDSTDIELDYRMINGMVERPRKCVAEEPLVQGSHQQSAAFFSTTRHHHLPWHNVSVCAGTRAA